jgi:hypothetical protein
MRLTSKVGESVSFADHSDHRRCQKQKKRLCPGPGRNPVHPVLCGHWDGLIITLKSDAFSQLLNALLLTTMYTTFAFGRGHNVKST